MLATWSKCEWLTKMWSILASRSRARSPTPVPASISMSSSTSMLVVRSPPPMPPLHPSTLIFMTCPRAAAAAGLLPSALWLRSRWRTDSRSIVNQRYHGRCEAFHSFYLPKTAPGRHGGPAGLAPGLQSRLVEELHLHPRDLDQVVIVQGMRLPAHGSAV